MAEATVATRLVTAEEFAELACGDRWLELVRGEVVETAPAFEAHSEIGVNIAAELRSFVKGGQIGRVTSADGGYLIERHPDTLLAPDAAFTRLEKLPEPVQAFPEVVPDLVAEVVSSSDRHGQVVQKVGLWRGAGVQVVWVVWHARREIEVSTLGQKTVTLGEHDTLTCEALLPGFAVPVAELLA